MSDMRRALAIATSEGVLRRAIFVALVVGTILTLINQGDQLLAGRLNWWKMGLTYLVPFAVSTHGAISARLRSPGA